MSPTSNTPYPHLPSQADLFYLCTTLSTSDTSLDLHVAPPSKPSLVVGVLLLGHENIQLLDLAPIDLLSMLRKENLRRLEAPEEILEQAIEVEIQYINESGEGLCSLSAGVQIPVTRSIETAASTQFDLLLIPGGPSTISPPTSLFQSSHSPIAIPTPTSTSLTTLLTSQSTILTTSTGILSLAPTPLLLNALATAPPPLLPSLSAQFPETAWEERRWARSGNVWSSGGGVRGVEMMAAWMREVFWDREGAVEWVLDGMGV